MSEKVIESASLKSSRIHVRYVDSRSSCCFALPLGENGEGAEHTTVAEPSECTHRSRRCEVRMS